VVEEEIRFRGHPNVQSLHARTLEITKDDNLSLRGDCIVGVGASKACADLDPQIRKRVQDDSAVIRIELIVGSESYSINGRGDNKLTLLNEHDIVIRKTHFVCPRTLSVGCDKASSDLPRSLVRKLQDSTMVGLLRISVE
jgi:hypothetical protein